MQPTLHALGVCDMTRRMGAIVVKITWLVVVVAYAAHNRDIDMGIMD